MTRQSKDPREIDSGISSSENCWCKGPEAEIRLVSLKVGARELRRVRSDKR